nr:hypothetical protein [Tanacetum cinerariifolium]
MEHELELSYKTLTRVYLGSYEPYKGVGAEVELLEHGFELQGSKMVEMGQFGIIREQSISSYKGYRGGGSWRSIQYVIKKRVSWLRGGCVLEEEGEECGFDSKEDEVVPKVDDVSLVDGIFNGAFVRDGDEYFVIREGLEDEAWVEAMKKECIEEEEDEYGEENEGDDYLIKMRWINVVRNGYSDFGFQKVFRKMQKCSWG